MSAKIIKFYTARHPDDVLSQAVGVYIDVLVLGYDTNGNIDARSNLGMNKEVVMLLIEQFKHKLLNGDYDE